MRRFNQLVVVFSLLVLSCSPFAPAGQLVDPGGEIEDIVADPIRNYAYLTLTTNEIARVDLGTGAVYKISAPDDVLELSVAPDASRLFVALIDVPAVAVYSLPDLSHVDTYSLSSTLSVKGVVADNERLYVGYHGGLFLSIVSLDSGEEIYYGKPGGRYFWQLHLSPDLQTLFGSQPNVGPGSILMYDLSSVPPIQIGEDCYHGAISSASSIAFSPDGSFIFVNGHYVLGVSESGLLYEKHNTLHRSANSVVVSSDGAYVFAGSFGGNISVTRTSDWLTFRVQEVQGFYIKRDGLVLSADGSILAAVIEYEESYPDRIELLDAMNLDPNRGGISLRPLDSENGLPIQGLSLSGGISQDLYSSDDWIDASAGIYGVGPLLERDDHRITIYAQGYEVLELDAVSVLDGMWTDLGDIELNRTAEHYPNPTYSCAVPALPSGSETSVLFHGRGFHPDVEIVAKLGFDGTVQEYSWIDSSTVAATIDVPEDELPHHKWLVEALNPGHDRGENGYGFVRRPPTSQPTFDDSEESVSEGAGDLQLEVLRSGSSVGQVSVDYQTVAGSAIAGEDFTASDGTLLWLDGETETKMITVPIVPDADVEGSETFTVELSNVVGGNLGDIPVATVTIIDDDAAYLRFDEASYEVAEDGGAASLPVTRTVRTDNAVTVNYGTTDGSATSGEDYISSSGVLSWAAGDEDPKIISVPISDDSDSEGNETLTVSLSSPGGDAVLDEPSEVVLTIVDDDASIFVLELDAVTVNERDGSIVFSVLRTNASSGAVTVDYGTADGTAVADEDYSSATGTLSWTDGDSEPKSFMVTIIEDGTTEPDEILTVELTNPTGPSAVGSPGTTVVTIGDNDQSTLRFSSMTYQGAEVGGAVEISIVREGTAVGDVSIDYSSSGGTATLGQDYVAVTGVLSWVEDELGPKTFNVQILDDNLVEGPETVFLELSNPVGNVSLTEPDTATLTITDDETLEAGINQTAEGDQTLPRVGVDGNGNSVVVWQSWNQDGSGWGVYARRINSAGNMLGGEFQVAQTTSGNQQNPDVAVAADGSFMVVWQDDATGGTEIVGRRFDAAAAPLGDEFVVNTSDPSVLVTPRVAIDGNGRYLVLWQGNDASGKGIVARCFNANGTPVAAEFAVNTTTSFDQDNPAVAGSPLGGFVAVWESYLQDGSDEGIVGRRFSSTGAPLAGEFAVNGTVAGTQAKPSVAVTSGGGVLVVWQDSGGLDGDGFSIQGQWFEFGSRPSAEDFQVNLHTEGHQWSPAVHGGPMGHVVVVWESFGQDGSEFGVFGRVLTENDGFASDEIQFNNYTPGWQHSAAVAGSESSRYMTVWASQAQDGDGQGVYGSLRSFESLWMVFSDGFEGGTSAAWTTTVPEDD